MPRVLSEDNKLFFQNAVPAFSRELSDMLNDMQLHADSTAEEKAIDRQLEICVEMMKDSSNLSDNPHRGEKFSAAWNEASRLMGAYLGDNAHRGTAVWQALMGHSRELEALDDTRKIFIRATRCIEDLRENYFAQDPAQLRREQEEDLNRYGLTGHEPSLEECHTLSFTSAPLDVLMDRMLWLSAQNMRASISNRSPDKGIYGQTLARLVNELMRCPVDVQAEFFTMTSRHELALQSRAYDAYERYLTASPDQSENGRQDYALQSLREDPYFEAASLHTNLVEQLILGSVGDLSLYLKAAETPNNPYQNEKIVTMNRLVNNGILDHFSDKYKQSLKSQPNPPGRDQIDARVKEYREAFKRPQQVAAHKQLSGTSYLLGSGMETIHSSYERLRNDKGGRAGSFREVKNAFDRVYRARPDAEDYARTLAGADDALSAYLEEAKSLPGEEERRQFAAGLQVALRRVPALEEARRNEAISPEEEAAVNRWYESFLSKAGEQGLDLRDARDRMLVSWYRDDPAGEKGAVIPVPAYVAHGDYATMGDTGELTPSYAVNPGWLEENVVATGQDISLREKKKLYEMAGQGRLMVRSPLDGDMQSMPVLVTKDGGAGILRHRKENYVHKDELKNPPVEPRIVEPGPRPDENPVVPPAAHGWKRFARAVTFGLAYRRELREYARQQEQKVQEQAAWEVRNAEYQRLTTDGVPNETYLREHADYVEKARTYQIKLERYNRLSGTYAGFDQAQDTANRVCTHVEQMSARAFEKPASTLGDGLHRQIESDRVLQTLAKYDSISSRMDDLRLRRAYLNAAGERAGNPRPGVKQVQDLARQEQALSAMEKIVEMVGGLRKDRASERASQLRKCYPNLSFTRIAGLTPAQEGILAKGVLGRVNCLYNAADLTSPVAEMRGDDMADVVRAQLLAAHLDDPEFCKYLEEEFPENLSGLQCDTGTLFEMGMHPEKSNEIARRMSQFVADKPRINRQIDEVLKKARQTLDKPIEMVRSLAKALYIRNHQEKKIPIPADPGKVEQEVGILEKTFAFNQLVACHMKELKALVNDPSRERLNAISDQLQSYRQKEQEAKSAENRELKNAAPQMQPSQPAPQQSGGPHMGGM